MKKLLLLLFLIPNLVMGEESEINLCSNQDKSNSKIYEINIQNNGDALAKADFNNDDILDNFIILQGDSLNCGSAGCATYLYLGGSQERCYMTSFSYTKNDGYFVFDELQKNGIKSIIRTDSDGKLICGLTRDRKNNRWVKANTRHYFNKIDCKI